MQRRLERVVTPALQEIANIHDNRTRHEGGRIELALLVHVLDLEPADLVLEQQRHSPEI